MVPHQIGHPFDLRRRHAVIRQKFPHQRSTLLLLILSIGVTAMVGSISGDELAAPSADAAAKKSEARYTVKGLFGREVLYTARQKDSVLTLDVPAGSATFRTTVQDMQTLLNEGVSTLVVQTEKGSTTLNLSLLVEGQKGTDRVVLRRLGENTFLTVGLRCRRDLIVGR